MSGTAVLALLLGWRSCASSSRGSGLGYMLGVALVGVALSIELVVGVPFSFATIVLTGAALVLGRRRRCAGRSRAGAQLLRPSGGARGAGSSPSPSARLIVVYLEALFRAGRLAGLSAWDAWAFWVPKAKAIYFFGGLDEQFFRELANPTYPPLVPALEASAFHFMGSADVVTLHVQFWFFACGFVAAVGGLLAPRVPALLLWPFVLLVLVAPRVVGRNLDPQADFLLDYFFALAALLVALWLVDREPWLLATASVFMGAALLRSGTASCSSRASSSRRSSGPVRQWRYAWPRLGLAASRRAVAIAIPWRIWFTSRDLTGELPSAGAARALRLPGPRLACVRVRAHGGVRLRPLARRRSARRSRRRARVSGRRPRAARVRAHAVRPRDRGPHVGALVVHRARAAVQCRTRA